MAKKAIGRSPLTPHQQAVEHLISPPTGKIWKSKKVGGRPPSGVKKGEKVSDYPMVTLRLPPDQAARLKVLGRFLDLPAWRVVLTAMDALESSLTTAERKALEVLRSR